MDVNFIGDGSQMSQIVNNINDLAFYRPFVDGQGRSFVSVYNGAGDKANEQNWTTRMVTNGVLRPEEWKTLDEAVLRISTIRLNGWRDLISRGLTFQLGNAFGTSQLEWHDIGDSMEATISMDAITRGRNDTVNYNYNYLPVPIVHADYELNARTLATSRNLGNGIDVNMAEFAAEKVAMQLESMLFTDTTFSYGKKDGRDRNTIYSFLNHPDRNKKVLSRAWDDPAKTPDEILADVMDMKKLALKVHKYGPFVLYIPTMYEMVLDQDYAFKNTGTIVGGTTLTIRERIMKLGNITAIITVDMLPDNNMVLVQATPDVVRIVQGIPLQNIQWSVEGGMAYKFKVWTIQVPQIRSDQVGQSGIVHSFM